jgi:FkbM family methyltransferase
MKSVLRKMFRWAGGRSFMQPVFERLHTASLAGMNIGSGGRLADSGELNLIRCLAEHYPREASLALFDVGANEGDYALALLEAFQNHPNAKIVAFEISPRTYEPLARRLAGRAPITLEPIGLSAKAESRTLFQTASTHDSGMASLYPRRLDHFHTSLDVREQVRLDTLDHYCRTHAVERIDFLKLDIEGHELSALQGAGQMLESGRIDFIQFEFGGCNIDSRTYFQDFYYLLHERYSLYRILPHGFRVIPAYQESQEAFMTTNFLARRKERHANFLRD